MTVLEDLDHVNDIGLLSSKYQDTQQKAECLSKTSSTVGLNVDTKKTQALRKSTRVNDPVVIGGKRLEDVEEFTYLGTKVTSTVDCDQEISTRISKTNQAFTLLKPVWRATNLSVLTKVKIFRSNVSSILLYGAECWKISVSI